MKHVAVASFAQRPSSRNATRCGVSLRQAGVVVVALAALATVPQLPAANLLVNPGFEAPQDNLNSTSSDISGWTLFFDAQRATFKNHTPAGKWSLWAKTFQAIGGGAAQTVNVVPGTNYTLTSQVLVEGSYATTEAVLQLKLDWQDAGGGSVGTPALFEIHPSDPVTANVWSPFSVSGTAPANAAKVQVFLGWEGGGTVTGAQSAFFDDVVLDGLGSVPNTSTWVTNGSGDWNQAGNWANGTVPNGIGAEAEFLGAITANKTVYTDTAITAGKLTFNNANTYVLTGSGSLTLQTSSGNAQVIVQAGTQKLNLPVTVASNTTLNVSPGATLLVSDPVTVNAGRTLTQTGGGTVTYQSNVTVLAGAAVAFGNTTHAHELNISATGAASVEGTGTVLTVDGLSNAGKVDVKKGSLVVSYGTGPNPTAAVRAQLAAAYQKGKWNGASGILSSAAGADARGATSVGYADVGGSVLVKYTWTGDANLDGLVNAADASLISAAGTTWSTGDFNYDGKVSPDDYALFSLGAAYGKTNINSVPEPAALGLLAVAVPSLLARRRRA